MCVCVWLLRRQRKMVLICVCVCKVRDAVCERETLWERDCV